LPSDLSLVSGLSLKFVRHGGTERYFTPLLFTKISIG
jgi:hypothetical protein